MDPSTVAEFQRLLGGPGAGLGALADVVGIGSLGTLANDPLGAATTALEARRRQQVEGAGYDPDKGLYDRYSEMLGVLGPTIAERSRAAADAMRRGDMATYQKIATDLSMDFGSFLGSIQAVGRAIPYHLRSGVEQPTQHNPRGLPMDEASRMKRAREMGFDTSHEWYHGAPKPFDGPGFDSGRLGSHTNAKSAEKAHFLTSDPEVAGSYAAGGLRATYQKHAGVPSFGDVAREAERRALAARGYDVDGWSRPHPKTAEDYTAVRAAVARAEAEFADSLVEGANITPTYVRPGNQRRYSPGEKSDIQSLSRILDQSQTGKRPADTVVLRGIDDPAFRYDPWVYRNPTLSNSSVLDQATAREIPASDHLAVFDPSRIRSRFATFDPERADSSDLMASIAPWLAMLGGGVGLSALYLDGDEGGM